MQKLIRTWMKRAAISFGVFVALNVALAAGTYVINLQSAPVEPTIQAQAPAASAPKTQTAPAAVAEAPVPSLETPVAPAPISAAPVAQPPTAEATQGDFFVAVGLFSTPQRSDELVNSLTKAGLPAMQRPHRLGQRELQQVVLGPFVNHADATADLQRLKDLGGYNDARVVSSR